MLRRALIATTLLAAAGLAASAGAAVPGHPDCPVFPADNAWHADISALPVHPRSDAWLTSMGGSSRRLHPDFGPNGTDQPFGIPYVVVPSSHPKTHVAFQYADESDPGPYPFGPNTPIEGGSDRHAIMVDGQSCRLYELFDARYDPQGSTAGSGAIWDLRSNALRPATWTSADAAGLPIFAGLLRRDEVAAGNVDHALRVTASRTDRSFLWPARHQAGAAANPNLPPMGARFRMKANVDISRFRPDTQVVLRATKRYGLIVADNGSDWYFTGTSEPGWNTALLDELKSVRAGDFEAVDVSSLMAEPDSARVRGAPAPSPLSTRAPVTPTRAPATTTPALPPTTASPTTAAPTAASAPASSTALSSPTTTGVVQDVVAAPATRDHDRNSRLWFVVGLLAAAAAAIGFRRWASRRSRN